MSDVDSLDDYSLDPDNITRFVILANDNAENQDMELIEEELPTDDADDIIDYIEDDEEDMPGIEYHVANEYQDNAFSGSLMDNLIMVQNDDIIEDTRHFKEENISNENSEDTIQFVNGENDNSRQADLFTCSSCNISFSNVVQHIHDYHQEQQVMVEMCEEDITNGGTEEAEELIDPENLDDLIQYDEHIIPDETEENGGNLVSPKNKTWKMPQILNTLKEEECTDKDGRLYTRKVVQIEKFWDKSLEKQIEDKRNEARIALPIFYSCVETENGTTIMPDTDLSEINIKVEPGTEIRKMYRCSVCFLQFKTLVEFKSHTCKNDTHKCTTCNLFFRTQCLLNAHMKIHKSNKAEATVKSGGPYMCFECDTVFPSNKSLRLHRRMHGPIKQKHIEQFYGPAGPEAMDDLAEGEPPEPREQFECQICNKWYDKAFEKIHMGVHSGELQYNCHICNRKFFTESNLSMHMRVHNIEKPQAKKQRGDLPYMCGFCDRQFARPHEKVKHERIHTGEKPHECEICGKKFRVSYCLTLHMRTHTGARPYECQHCHKRFKAHSVFNHHLMTHSEVRAYKCPYCPKAFKTAVQLAGHKNSHTKPFACTECNRPFASLYAVRAHMEIHKKQNSLKYKCSICGASYARGFALRDHMKEQHQSTVVTEDDGVVIDETLLNSHLLPEGDTIEIPIEDYHYDSNDIPTETYIKIEGPIEYQEVQL